MAKDYPVFRRFGLVMSLLIFMLLGGCAGTTKHLPLDAWVAPVPSVTPGDDRSVHIAYLGTGGYLIREGERAILTAPFFSHPSMLKVALGKINADHERIDRALYDMKPDLAPVPAILVGHAHYDHLMDIPYIAEKYTPDAVVYGSRTMFHTLAPTLCECRRVAVNPYAATVKGGGRWIVPRKEPTIRFMPLVSEHAPHFLGLKFFTGDYKEDLTALPTRAYGWKEGQTFAYLIDFLADDGKTVMFRIHFQDSASNPEFGFPPPFENPLDKRRVDLAILCVASFKEVHDYPKAILKALKPRHVLLGHWENFFRPLPAEKDKLTTVPNTDVKDFIREMQKHLPDDAKFILPRPGRWLTIPVSEGS